MLISCLNALDINGYLKSVGLDTERSMLYLHLFESLTGWFQTQVLVFEMGYIGAHGVAALHRYKYSGVDHSYLAKYILNPFWTRFVTIFPLWMP